MSDTPTTDAPPAADAPADPPGGSLFDTAAPAPAADGAQPGQPTAPAARPDWLPPQFWQQDQAQPNVQALAKSWQDLRAQISRGEHKPPAEPGGYKLPAVEGLPQTIGAEDDPVWGEIRGAAHAAGVSQQQLEAIAAPYLKHVAGLLKDFAPPDPQAQAAAVAAEKAKLGPQADAVLRDVEGWMKGMLSRGVLSEPEFHALRGVTTAEGVRALAKLRELSGEKPIPTDALSAESMTQADAERMLQESYRTNDMGARQRALATLAELEKRGQLRL